MTRTSLSALGGILLVVCGIFTMGCGSQEPLYARQGAELDSMYAENRTLRTRLRALRDSLQFYDDIDSGQYYRDQRMLQQEIDRLEYELVVCAEGGRTIQTLLVEDLFEPASANLLESSLGILAGVADTLASLPSGYRFRVEGHADDTPIGPKLQDMYPSNWELSAARAAAVARHLVDTYELSGDRFEVISLGTTQPVASNASAAGRRQNRRIEIGAIPGPAEDG